MYPGIPTDDEEPAQDENPDEGDADLPADANYCLCEQVGTDSAATETRMTFCGEHSSVAQQAQAILAQGAEGDMTAAWQQAAALWTDALNAEYDGLKAKLGEENAQIVEDDRAAFFAQLEARRAAANDPATAEEAVCEQLMAQTAALCAISAAAPERPYYDATSPDDAISEAQCVSNTVETVFGATCGDILCEHHREVDASIRDLLAGAPDTAWETALTLWQAELDAGFDARIQAAGDNAPAAAMRNSYGLWLSARATLLRLAYPDRPDLVNEILARTIRARALELCAAAN